MYLLENMAFNLKVERASDSPMHNPLINDMLSIPLVSLLATCERSNTDRAFKKTHYILSRSPLVPQSTVIIF